MLRSVFVAAALSGTVVLQSPPTPIYDATFAVGENQVYTGTTTFAVDSKGAVRGKMKLRQPIGVLADLGGTVKDAVWTIEYPYAIPDRNCTGVLKGTGKVPADKKSITGSVVISGDCSPNAQNATFTFTRQPPKMKSRFGL